eukprot:12036685-Alexandrium_andersonii.AAC.1
MGAEEQQGGGGAHRCPPARARPLPAGHQRHATLHVRAPPPPGQGEPGAPCARSPEGKTIVFGVAGGRRSYG